MYSLPDQIDWLKRQVDIKRRLIEAGRMTEEDSEIQLARDTLTTVETLHTLFEKALKIP